MYFSLEKVLRRPKCILFFSLLRVLHAATAQCVIRVRLLAAAKIQQMCMGRVVLMEVTFNDAVILFTGIRSSVLDAVAVPSISLV